MSGIVEVPTAEVIIDTLVKKNPGNSHPRLILTDKRIEELNLLVTNDKEFADIYNCLLADSLLLLEENPLCYEKKDGTRLLPVSRKALLWISKLAMSYCISKDTRYLKRAVEELMNVCSFPDWNPRHFLDTAEMATAVSLGYDWLYNELSTEQREFIRSALVKKGLRQIMEDYQFVPERKRTWGWNDPSNGNYPNNWLAVCNGGLAFAALAVGDEEKELCGQVLSHGLLSVEALLAKFAPDGAWYEGPGYWEYSVKYLVFYITALRSALGTDYGMAAAQGLENSGKYILDITGPGGCFNLDDTVANNFLYSTSVLMGLADIYSRQDYKEERIRQIHTYKRPAVFDVIYYRADIEKKIVSRNEDAFYQDCSIVTMRTGRKERDMFLGFHGGQDGRGHCHLDCGSFVFDCFGKRWAIDLGTEPRTYYVKKMDDRYEYYRYRAEGHNTFVINPDGRDDQDRSAVPFMEKFVRTENKSLAIADLTEVYAFRGVRSAKRGVLMDKTAACVIIRDEVYGNQPIEYYWFMHTYADIRLVEDGKGAILKIDEEEIQLWITGEEGYYFEIYPAIPLPQSPVPADSSENVGVRKLVIHLSGRECHQVEVLITTESTQKDIVQKYCGISLSNW